MRTVASHRHFINCPQDSVQTVARRHESQFLRFCRYLFIPTGRAHDVNPTIAITSSDIVGSGLACTPSQRTSRTACLNPVTMTRWHYGGVRLLYYPLRVSRIPTMKYRTAVDLTVQFHRHGGPLCVGHDELAKGSVPKGTMSRQFTHIPYRGISGAHETRFRVTTNVVQSLS